MQSSGMQSISSAVKLEGGLVRLQKDPDQDAQHRSIDRVLVGRILGLMRPYRVKRNWLFFVVFLRCVQQPAFVWAVAATINGPIAQHQSTSWIVFFRLGSLKPIEKFKKVFRELRQLLPRVLQEFGLLKASREVKRMRSFFLTWSSVMPTTT